MLTTIKKRPKKSGSLYLRKKVRILNQLGIMLDSDQMGHMLGLKTEAAIDAYARDLIMNHDFDAPHPKKLERNEF